MTSKRRLDDLQVTRLLAEYQRGLEELGRHRAEDIKRRRLNYFEGSSRYFKLCESMISSGDGVQRLTSATGFQHSTLRDMDRRSEEGCQLCREIRKAAKSVKVTTVSGVLTLFAMRGDQPCWGITKQGEMLLFDGLGLYAHDSKLLARLVVYTAIGTST
jgi:hypothetical protein